MAAVPEKLVEFSILGPANLSGLTEILRNVLIKEGLDQTEVIDLRQDSRAGVQAFFKTAVQARALKDKVAKCNIRGVSIQLTTLKKPDWRDRWKKDFAPFQLTKHLDVVPRWRQKDYSPRKNRIPILIDTITAFGTGLHDTTRFMSELIEEYRKNFESFLDIGTGTGILAIIARKLGAKEVWALDIDPECIDVAIANARANRCRFDVLKAADLRKFKPKKQFDFVAANLITHDLIRLKKDILNLVKPGKFLAVSGISVENASILKREFTKLPLSCIQVKKSQHWVAFLFQRKKRESSR